jgi:hypothetical protein
LVSNDRTHLEGVWNVADRARIETKTLTTEAPKHEITSKTETRGWSISLSPAALLSAALAFTTPAGIGAAEGLACLPNIAVHESDGSSSSTTHAPQMLNAGDLYVRCDNAVFRGSTIHAKTLEMLVSGDLTVETLANEFRSESNSRDISACLGAIAGLTQEVALDHRFLDPSLSAVPAIRIAEEEALSVKVQELAKIVGEDRFYLTVGGLLYKKGAEVGLKPDGVVARNDAEKITAGQVLEEKVREVESHKRTVINPSISEFMAMMNQIDEFKQVRAKIAAEQAVEKAFQAVGKPKPQSINTSVRDVVIDALLEEGATPDEIEKIVLNERMNDVLSDSQEVRKLYGKGPIAVIVGNPSKEEYEAQVRAQEQRYNRGYLEASLGLFSDGALALDEFATENPRLAQLSLVALDAALSGPSRFMVNYCGQELGIKISDEHRVGISSAC